MFVFGISYAIASISCALPLFTAAVVGTFRRENLLSSVAVFVAYALGMTLVLLVLTVSLGHGQAGAGAAAAPGAAVRQPRLRGDHRGRRALPRPLRLVRAPGARRRRRRRIRAPSTPSPAGPATSATGSTTSGADAPRAAARARRWPRCSPPPSACGRGGRRAVGRFAELLEHDGVEEDLELRSSFGLMAFHGGNLEEGTDVIAAAVAEQAGASLYAVRQPVGLRWHLPSVEIGPADSPALAAFVDHVDVADRGARLRTGRDVDHPAPRGQPPRPRRPRRRPTCATAMPGLRGDRRPRADPDRAARRPPRQPGEPPTRRWRAARAAAPHPLAHRARCGATSPTPSRCPTSRTSSPASSPPCASWPRAYGLRRTILQPATAASSRS